jgi:hypothetical protein
MLAACLPTSPSEEEAYRRNRERWEALGPAAYEFVFQRSACECLLEWTVPMRVTVREAQIQSIRAVQSDDELPATPGLALSIEEIFDFIGRAIDQGARQVDVKYDRRLGYPSSAYINKGAVDAQVRLSVTELRAVRQ